MKGRRVTRPVPMAAPAVLTDEMKQQLLQEVRQRQEDAARFRQLGEQHQGAANQAFLNAHRSEAALAQILRVCNVVGLQIPTEASAKPAEQPAEQPDQSVAQPAAQPAAGA